MSIWDALLLAVIEGVTEFLPISSTGHMIIASHFRGIQDDGFVKAYTVIIQFGAILAVVWLYRQKFLNVSLKFYTRLVAACIPAGILGLLFEKSIDRALGDIRVVIASLFIGGLVLIMIDRWSRPKGQHDLEKMSPLEAMKVGSFQAIALIPGVSRSGATIVGAMLFGFNRQQAAEFSFLISVPIMAGATLLKLIKVRDLLNAENGSILATGLIVSFIVAVIVVRAFIGFLQKYSLQAFGWYRLLLATALLLLISAT